MQGQPFEMRENIGAAYLQQLRALASEIDVAMGAIATNTLTNLQTSVAKQETLCYSLAMMAKAAGNGLQSSENNLPVCVDVLVEEKIRLTIGSIRNLNLQYAALLKHSGKSIAILASLCRSHTGQFDALGGMRSKHQTWSCEV
jgi:hypothetical protein